LYRTRITFFKNGTLPPQLCDGLLYGTLVDMIKETIPELQKLSTADKFALAVELWDELSSNPDEIPVTERS
jgi:hypothetical protein